VKIPMLALAAALATAATASAEPVRVATLLPFVEDALRLDPERFAVVASVRRSLHVPVADGTIDLGNPHSPSFETLVQADPDLVVGDRMLHAALAPRLAGLGAELVLVDTTSVAATLDALDALGQRAGGAPALADAVADTRADLASLALPRAVPVLLLFGTPGSFFAFTERTWLGDLAARIGFRNLAPKGEERFPGLVAVNDEVLAQVQPELVLLVAHGEPDKIRADFARRAAAGGPWAGLGAARLGVHALDPALFSANPGLALARAGSELAALVPRAEARAR
jgi:iron complex transport system substrate-binding protein